MFANQVYQELISDRNHLHLNATRWNSMTEFVKFLGREGICVVDEEENKGWFITWIDNTPSTLAKKEAIQKMDRLHKDQESRDRRMIDQQIQRGKLQSSSTTDGGADGAVDPTEVKVGDGHQLTPLTRSDYSYYSNNTIYSDIAHTHTQEFKREGNEKIAIDLQPRAASLKKDERKRPLARAFGDDDEDEDVDDREEEKQDDGEFEHNHKRKQEPHPHGNVVKRPPPSALRSVPVKKLRQEEEEELESSMVPTTNINHDTTNTTMAVITDLGRADEDAPWLHVGLVVKNRNRKIGGDGRFYGRKGVVRQVVDEYVAELELFPVEGEAGGEGEGQAQGVGEPGVTAATGTPPQPPTRIRVDQEQLETVVPALGAAVRIVKGRFAGRVGRLDCVHFDRYCARIRLHSQSQSQEQEQEQSILDNVEYEWFCRTE